MKILVCISHVPDTTAKIAFVDNNKSYNKEGQQFIIGPNEELALTRAIDIKEAKGGNITALTVGSAEVEPTLRKALAMGADDAIRVNMDPKDAFNVSKQIAEVAKANQYDVILTGREAIDYNGGQVGEMIAEWLIYPSVSGVNDMDLEPGKAILKREIDGGYEKIECDFPLIITGQKGIAAEPKIPAMRGIMMARKKPLIVVEPVQSDNATEVLEHSLPASKASCKMVSADDMNELVRLLHEEAKVI
ncbi:MAG: electron transfer flavoprotein subunit beta/FixA family protein [Bacteroidales bacterium]|nr:electron transfer flavoprotein subunit beta/FixA family protein [Bacteroidales bacterium]